MSTTDLKLDAPGTLPRPGPIGRILRLAFAVFCGSAIYQIVSGWQHLITGSADILSGFSVPLFIAFFITNYVVNIGFSSNWGRRPQLAVALALAVAALAGLATTGSPFGPVLGWTIALWLAYFYSHLGLCFLLSALLATPGCEMRALHHLYERISGVPVREHYCPVGPLHPVDQWEARQFWRA